MGATLFGITYPVVKIISYTPYSMEEGATIAVYINSMRKKSVSLNKIKLIDNFLELLLIHNNSVSNKE